MRVLCQPSYRYDSVAGLFRKFTAEDTNFKVFQSHDLPCVNLAGFAQFLLPIHIHVAAGDDHFSFAAAVAEADQFQELIEFHVVAVEFELDVLHVSDGWEVRWGVRED